MANSSEDPGSSSSSIVGFVLLAVVLVGAGMYFLGRRSHVSAQNSSPQTAGQTAQVALDAATPAGTPGPAVPAAAPAGNPGGRRLAPHDTFYLLQYTSVKTPTGVIGFEPGQEVHLVEVHKESRTLVVGDGEAQVEVGPEKLTNDLDIAALVRQKDQANQAKIAAYIQGEQRAYDEAQKQAAIETEKDLDKVKQDQRQAAASANATAANNNARTGVGGVNTGSKLDEPAVPVGGTSGYGYSGSSSYGSPYSYFSGGSSTGAATSGAGRGQNPANVGH